MNKLIQFLTGKSMRTIYFHSKGLYRGLDDKTFLKKIFRARLGYPLNLEDPKTFNEKIQWLKLYDRRPEYTMMVDKHAVKQYVGSVIGEDYLIPTLGVWDSVEDIDFDSLPDQFVLKCTHDSGSIVICRDKKAFDIEKAKAQLNQYMKRDYYLVWREWPYKNVKHRIIAEKYLADSSGELRDYKFFTFNGKVKILLLVTDRNNPSSETKYDFYDTNFKHLNLSSGYPQANLKLERSETFDEMIRLAEKLSENIPHLRVDFYNVNGKVYFGELTFYRMAGLAPFDPPEWDSIWGEWITLPEKYEEKT